MEKFKEKKLVNILDICVGVLAILAFISLILTVFNLLFLGGFFGLMLLAVPFIVASKILSKKDEYTREFLKYMRDKLDKYSTLKEYNTLLQEFNNLAIKNNSYCLSFPVSVRKIHDEILIKIDALKKIENKKDKFGLNHIVLYSKGWYKRYDIKSTRKTIWDDLVLLLEADGYKGTFIGDSDKQLQNRIAYLLVTHLERLPITGNRRSLSNFYESIKEYNCWKYGYITKVNSFRDVKGQAELPEYDYNESVARYCLSIFGNLNKDEWSSCKPDYNILPRPNNISDDKINSMFI